MKTENKHQNQVVYDWSLEEIDENEDIVDSDFMQEIPADWVNKLPEDGHTFRICLVRDLGNQEKGLIERCWAYVVDGKLPEYFKDSAGTDTIHKVSEKFHKHLAAAITKAKGE